jgi:diguanylate cyclase (GGDEF)-like protein
LNEGPPHDGKAHAHRALDALARVRAASEHEFVVHALASVKQAAYHWTIADDRLQWSSNAAEVLGISQTTLINSGRGYASLLDPDNFASRYEAVMHSAVIDEGEGVAFQIEYSFRPKGRTEPLSLWLEDSGRWIAGPDGRPEEVFGVVRQINDRHQRDQHLRFLGNCDPLTGMMNRGRMAEALAESIAAAQREGHGCAFLIAAIANLGMVNDAYGFDIADEIIIAVGRRLRQVVRSGDAIGRFSGAKFGIILANCDEEDLEKAAERFLSVARESVIDTERGPVWAMLSIGGLFLPANADASNLAMARAEEALAEARRLPTDGFVAFRPSAEKASARSLNAQCAAEIVSALKEERFTLAFQPIVEAASGKAVMHEALLRMRSADGEKISAVHLIPVAEKLGLVRLIDRRVILLALETLERFAEARLTLNISAITATDPRWFGRLVQILTEQRHLAQRLTIEITETAAVHDLNEIIRFVCELRNLGCAVAVDDFGAGYTSFRNLKVLNVNMVKLDGSFCENLSTNRDNQYFVRSLIDLAKKFDLKTVAEWVRTEEDARLLTAWGIDYLQGDIFGEAVHEPPWTVSQQALNESAGGDPQDSKEQVADMTALVPAEAQDVPPINEQPLEELPVIQNEETPFLDFSRLRMAINALDARPGRGGKSSE